MQRSEADVGRAQAAHGLVAGRNKQQVRKDTKGQEADKLFAFATGCQRSYRPYYIENMTRRPSRIQQDILFTTATGHTPDRSTIYDYDT